MNQKKTLPFIVIFILTAASLGILQPAHSQPTNPSVPEFTAKYVDLSYSVPPTYGVSQYTGQQIVTEDGYSVDNRSIQFTIKNQPFTPYTDSNGTQINLYYNFRIKGSYGTDWDYYPFAANGVTTSRYGGIDGGNSTESPADFGQSQGEYTTITFQIPGVYMVPAEAQLDVQVQAIIGYMEPSDYLLAGCVYVFTGQYGDWSNSQTVMVTSSSGGESNSTTNIQPTQTPIQANTTTPQSPLNTSIPLAANEKPGADSVPLTVFIAVTTALTIVIIAVSLLYFTKHDKNEKTANALTLSST